VIGLTGKEGVKVDLFREGLSYTTTVKSVTVYAALKWYQDFKLNDTNDGVLPYIPEYRITDTDFPPTQNFSKALHSFLDYYEDGIDQ